MAIYQPGKRDPRHKNRIINARRTMIVSLSLTSMVDMFTILVVFLLQNYSSTGEILYIPKNVHLPQASQVKELKPAHVVILTEHELMLDKDVVGSVDEVKTQKDWMIPNLRAKLAAAIEADVQKAKAQLKNVLPGANGELNKSAANQEIPNKVTIQADKDLDFLTLKKVMFTVSEAGAGEINFAVARKELIQQTPGAVTE